LLLEFCYYGLVAGSQLSEFNKNFRTQRKEYIHTRTELDEAHAVQTQLIEADEGEGKTKMTLVMVHAQDHLMTSILAKELITELVDVYRQNAVRP
jgi:cellobiose-specific phosphotransferase system component IIA